MIQLSKKMLTFDPSENQENSSGFCYPQSPCAWARRRKAVPPVVNISILPCGGRLHIPTGVSRSFILSCTGISEPSD